MNSMIEGPLARKMFLFSIPLMLSGILQQMYSWADAFILGNVNGDAALAAIGATAMVPNVFSLLIIGFSGGISIYAALLYGKGNEEETEDLLSSCLAVISIVILILSGFVCCFAGAVLKMLNTSADIFADSKEYLCIYIAGSVFLVIYNVYSAVLRGRGDSKAAFWTVLVSTVTNIILDLIFVALMGWGVAGAAAATVLSQAGMAAFIVQYSNVKYKLRPFDKKRKNINGRILKECAEIGLPLAFQAGVRSFGNLVLQSFMNSFGSVTVAAVTTAYRIDNVIMLPVNNLGTGVSTAVAQNKSADNEERSRHASRIGVLMMSVFALAATVFVYSLGRPMLLAFGLSEGTADAGTEFFRCISAFYVVYGISSALKSSLDGLGDTVFTSTVYIAALGARIAASYLLGHRVGIRVFAAAEILSWVLMVIMYSLRCVSRFRKKA